MSLYLLMYINEFCRLKYLIIVHASISQNIARKSQVKSMTSYLLMNINDLGAMAVSLRYLIFLYASIL